MEWHDVRTIYPNSWVKLLILSSHEADNKEYIDKMDVIETFDNDDEATEALVNCKDKEIVYYTSREKIYSEIRNLKYGYLN